MSCPFGYSAGSNSSAASSSKDNNDLNIPPSVVSDDGVYYDDYLGLEKLLSAQNPLSREKCNKEAHDEMLFIITHQAYELWFKQVLHEIDSLLKIFCAQPILEKELGVALSRLNRICEIQKVLLAQISILETMHPQDFLEFRHLLTPASGFQSIQFKLIENKLGILRSQRFNLAKTEYLGYFRPEHQIVLAKSERLSLLQLVEAWLERTPFLKMKNWSFIEEYRKAVDTMIEQDREIIRSDRHLSAEQKAAQLAQIEATATQFESLWDEKAHQQLQEQGYRRISYKALQAALMISLYRDEPMLILPHKIIAALVEVDENLTLWRYRHTMMVHRMIGSKMGSGGSSGYRYLKSTTSDRYKVFVDFFNLSSYLIPSSARPTLPTEAKKLLGYYYQPESIDQSTIND